MPERGRKDAITNVVEIVCVDFEAELGREGEEGGGYSGMHVSLEGELGLGFGKMSKSKLWGCDQVRRFMIGKLWACVCGGAKMYATYRCPSRRGCQISPLNVAFSSGQDSVYTAAACIISEL